MIITKFHILTMSLGLGLLLTACTANSSPAKPATLSLVSTTPIGTAHAIALDGEQLLIINDRNELWQFGNSAPIAQDVSPDIVPAAGFGKVAWADTDGRFTLWQDGKIYHSQVRLSPHSSLLMLPFATIAVQDDNSTARLVRLEVQDNAVQVVAHFSPVLPDARPVQLNFTGDNAQGHIAVLSHPDSTAYRHGVLGDKVEAGQLQFLERHSLTPLAKPLAIKGLVFEANQPEILPHASGNHLVTTMAGNGKGASTVVIDNINGELTPIAQSEPLPSNRWQSPFVFHEELYAVQMPHLLGKLVRYQIDKQTLTPKTVGEAHSNHHIGQFHTNLTASTPSFAVIPNMSHTQISLLLPSGKLTPLPDTLPTKILQLQASNTAVYLLLANGQIWQVK